MSMYCDYDDLAVQVNEETLLQAADMTEPPIKISEDAVPDISAPPAEEPEPQNPPERDTITPSIVNASAEVAGYLARRYRLPSSPEESPAMLRKLTADIAIYNIFSRKGFAFAEEVKDHIIVRRYNAAIEYLKAVAENDADIEGLDDYGASDDDTEADAENYGPHHIWLYRS